MLHVRPEISQSVSRAVLVTGSARSGTTMMGTLLHSLEGLEYIFEPPFLYSLLPLIDQLPEQQFRLLYETYLFEDFLMDSVAGRRINLNQNDDSYIGNVKSESEIALRLSSAYRRADLFAQVQRRRIVYKMPDITPFLPSLLQYYPETRVIVMFREPESVVQSLRDKGWYQNDDSASRSTQGPFHHLDPDIPFWLDPLDVPFFQRSAMLDRLYLYYVNIYNAVTQLRDCLVVDYDSFIRDPVPQFGRVCEYINEHKATVQTQALIQQVYRRDDPPRQTLSETSPMLRDQSLKIIEKLSKLAGEERAD